MGQEIGSFQVYFMAYFVAQESDVSTGWVPFGFERRVSVVISASQ